MELANGYAGYLAPPPQHAWEATRLGQLDHRSSKDGHREDSRSLVAVAQTGGYLVVILSERQQN